MVDKSFEFLLSERYRWVPRLQPQKLIIDEETPDPESSFESQSDSINEENVSVKCISTMSPEISRINSKIHLTNVHKIDKNLGFIKKLIQYHTAKQIVFSLAYRRKRLQKIFENIQARKVTKIIKLYIQSKRIITAQILLKFKDHCATYIQKCYRGYIARKSIKKKKLNQKIIGLVLGWKVRKIMKHPSIMALKRQIILNPSTPLIHNFISRFHDLYTGKWASKSVKALQFKKILYKKSTLTLKVMHEKKPSFEDSNQKDPEGQRKVKFTLKNSESPKNYEPDFKAVPKKKILKNTPVPPVDWETLQEKLDQIFYESEAKFSNDETHDKSDLDNSLADRCLLFKAKPRLKNKFRKENAENWNLDRFETYCQEDLDNSSKFDSISISSSIPLLFPDSIFFISLEPNSTFKNLKKDYQNLRNPCVGCDEITN
jgi:IQ calmodulin-binding motif